MLVPDQNVAIKRLIYKQLKDIIQRGRLSAYNSEILLLEEVSLITYYYQKQLGYNNKLDDFYMPRYEQIYPIDLQDLQNRIYRFRAFEHYRKTDYNIPLSIVHSKVDEAVLNKLDIPKLNIFGDFPPFDELFKIVTILQNKGFHIIEKHHLPYPDISLGEAKQLVRQNNIGNISKIRSFQYSTVQAQFYIERFFKHLEGCYKDFVEYLFPTFKNELPFFSTLPHEYFFYMKDADPLKWGSFGYRQSKNGQTKFNFKEYVSMEKAFDEDGILSSRGFSFDNLLHSDYYNEIRTVDKFNTSKVDDFCVIRNWVYKLLKEDMREVLKQYDVHV